MGLTARSVARYHVVAPIYFNDESETLYWTGATTDLVTRTLVVGPGQ